jgi:hypothetical protein
MGKHEQARLSGGQRWLAAGVAAFGLVLTPIAFAVMYVTVTGLLRPYFGGLAWTVPVGTEAGFVGLFLADLLLEWIRKPLWWLPAVPYLLAAVSVALNALAGGGALAGILGHEVLPAVFFGYMIAAKAVVRRLALTDEDRARSLAMADARAHARDILRSALGFWWRQKTPLLLRRQLRSGRLPALVMGAVATGRAAEWEPAVEGWIAAAVALPERFAESLRAAREEASASPREALAEALPERPAAPAGPPPRALPASPPEGLPAAPPAPLGEAPARPSRRPARLVPARASDDDLAGLLMPRLAEGADLSATGAIKIIRDAAGGKGSIGHERAGKVLALAREQSSRVVQFGERRQA